MDFSVYKSRLREYLQSHGIQTGPGNINCINPEHQDDTASMNVRDESVKCFGRCGFSGDIYDVAGLLHGIPERGEQFKHVEKFFGGVSSARFQIGKEAAGKLGQEREGKERFEIDADAMGKVVAYLRSRAESGTDAAKIAGFCAVRGYPDPAYGRYLAWWPGWTEAEKALGLDVLRAAGIPVPEGGKKSSWNPPGVVCRFERGLKLQYIRNGETVKRGSHGSKTFPYPRLPEERSVVLVEGELDALSCIYAGLSETVALGGVQGLTVRDAKRLHQYEEITLLFDNDRAGRVASGSEQPGKTDAKPVVEIIRESGYTGRIRRAVIRTEKDADDLVKKGKKAELFEAVENAEEIGRVQSAESVDPEPEERAEVPEHQDEHPVEHQDEHEDEPGAVKHNPEEPATSTSIDPPFRFLGYDEKDYYFLPNGQNIVISIGRGTNSMKNWLNEIARASWWTEHFHKELDGETVFDIAAALEWVREEQYKVGRYNDERILGAGAHWDEKRIVLNSGKNLVCQDGSESSYEGYRGRNIFVVSKVELDVGAAPWTTADGLKMMHELFTFNFEQTVHYFAVAGFLAVAPFAPVFRRRPHIWITGRRGLGKTYLIEDLMVPILGEGYTFYTEGGTTEAAIRQSVGRDSRPVVLDEFEANGKYDRTALQNILSLARSAYAGTQKVKGSSSHRAISFSTKMMFCFASVNVNIENEADRSRIVICRQKESNGRMKRVPNPDGLRARIFRILPKVLEDTEAARQRLEDAGHDSRTCDTHAPLLAGFWNIVSDRPFCEGEEDRYTGMIDGAIQEIGRVERQDDEENILKRIFDEKIRVAPDKERTVWEMLTELDDARQLRYGAEVQRIGLHRYQTKDGKELLAISPKSPAIKRILEDTPFPNYREVLSRNEAVIEKSYPVRIAGIQERCLVMDWEKVYAKYHGTDEEEAEELPF